MYLQLRNGKIRIEEDVTQYGIAAELMSRGVPKEGIVLASNLPELPELTECAVGYVTYLLK